MRERDSAEARLILNCVVFCRTHEEGQEHLNPRQPPVLFVMCTHVLLIMVALVQVKKKRERDKETTCVMPHGVPKGEHL